MPPRFSKLLLYLVECRVVRLLACKVLQAGEYITVQAPSYKLKRKINILQSFRQLQIHKFADFDNLLDLRAFHKCGTLRICGLRTQAFL